VYYKKDGDLNGSSRYFACYLPTTIVVVQLSQHDSAVMTILLWHQKVRIALTVINPSTPTTYKWHQTFWISDQCLVSGFHVPHISYVSLCIYIHAYMHKTLHGAKFSHNHTRMWNKPIYWPWYFVSSTKQETPHYEILSTFLLFLPSQRAPYTLS